MKKEKFSFVKWLTDRDIEKILKSLGYEIMEKEDKNGVLKKRILRGKYDNGERNIIVFCKDLEYAEKRAKMDDAMREIIMQSPELRHMMSNILMTSALLGAANPDGFSKWSEMSSMAILKFDDFFLTENLSTKSEEEQLENDRRMTRAYQKYMTQKFGRFYNSMKSGYFKKLHKEIREEEQKQEEQDQQL